MFPYLAESSRRSCQKCTLPVQVKIWGKIGFPRKCVTFFFITFGFYGKKCRILVEEFDKFVRAAFDPYGRSFWRKTTARKNYVFYIFLGLRGENILIRHNLVCSLLTRLSFLTLELNFEIFLSTISTFFINSVISVWSSSIFSSKVSAESSKVLFTCTEEHSMKNWVSAGKCNSFSYTFGLYTKTCWTFGEEIQHFRQSCLLPARRIILKEKNFWKN